MPRQISSEEQKARDEFYAAQAEILDAVPPEFHNAFTARAWEDGHAYGYHEVLTHLRNIVSDFDNPIKKFEERIRKELKQ